MSDYIQLRDGLAIYKQKQSKNYYVYLRQKDDAGKYFEFRRSTRTDDEVKAREIAYGYFFSYTQKLSPEVFESNSKSKVLSICNEVLSILDKQTKESLKRSPQSAAYAACIRNQIIPVLPKSLLIKNLIESSSKRS